MVTIDAIDRARSGPTAQWSTTCRSPRICSQAHSKPRSSIENAAINLGSGRLPVLRGRGHHAGPRAHARRGQGQGCRRLEGGRRREARLDAKAADLEKRLKDGTPLDTLADEMKLEKQTKRGLKREADDADFGKAGIAAIFGSPKVAPVWSLRRGRREALVQGDGSVRAGGRRTRTRCRTMRRKSFASGIADDLLDQLVARLQRRIRGHGQPAPPSNRRWPSEADERR